MSMDEYPQSSAASGSQPSSGLPPHYGRPSRRNQLPILIGLLAGLIFFLVLPYMAEQVEYAITRGRERAEAEVAREQLAGLPDAVNRFRLAAKAIEPSVVAIQVVGRAAIEDEWSSFFGPGLRTVEGSGVIVDKAGYIVTNFHVINGASQITVQLSDGRTVGDVEIVGADPASDLAVLRAHASGLLPASWGDSDQLEVGDQVLAVGSPYGLAQTVTSGIISAKGRHRVMEELDRQDFLQTDAAINPGNSGGPLVNLRGEVIGINTAIYGKANQGIGFAIPSRLAQDVYTRLKAGETVKRGWLGVGLQDLNEALARQLKLQGTQGVLITELVTDSPADKAGLQPGDVILKWNGKPVHDSDELRFLVAGTSPGTTVKVAFSRNGENLETTITVGERPSGGRR